MISFNLISYLGYNFWLEVEITTLEEVLELVKP
jgi:hypothetical protein